MTPTITILPDKDALVAHMADLFVTAVADAIEENGVFAAALSGGGTPQPLYERLAQPDYANKIDWGNVHFFWGDERVVPITEDGNNYKQVKEALLDHVPIPEKNIWRVRTEYDARVAAHNYMRQLEAFAIEYQSAELTWPRFDFVLLGMGSDGHTASIFPFSPMCVDKATRAVSAEYEDRPSLRVTLTEPVFNSARRIYVMATGAKKASMIAEAVNGERDFEAYPIERIMPTEGVMTFMLDEAAAGKL